LSIDEKYLEPLYKSLGHEFSNPALLTQALTHPSLEGAVNYQRLEFLGDRVLGLSIAEILYTEFPNVKEGGLAVRLAALVRKDALAQVAAQIHLERYIRLAASADEERERGKVAIQADVCEAVIGALYLDGGIDVAKRFVARYWHVLIMAKATAVKDPKSLLQEWAQARGFVPPVYIEIERSGPDHSPRFIIEVRAGDRQPVRAAGGSKRLAEQAAAEAMLKEIKER
jgi:ribonuclease-3